MQIPKYANEEERNQLAKNYMYTTSTQEYIIFYFYILIILLCFYLFN